MGWYHIFTNESTKFIAFGLPYNAGVPSLCNLYVHVYHSGTLKKEERIYASVSIVSEIRMVRLYDIIILYYDEKTNFCLFVCLKSQSTIFQLCRDNFLSSMVEPVLSSR